jgi:hypothetical protein
LANLFLRIIKGSARFEVRYLVLEKHTIRRETGIELWAFINWLVANLGVALEGVVMVVPRRGVRCKFFCDFQ